MENEICVLKTLCYADIFDYPLTEDEVFTFLISDTPVEKSKIRIILQKSMHVSSKNDYFMLKKRSTNVLDRIKRKKISATKFAIARKYAQLLSHVPTIHLIAISGNLAVENAEQKDDIDFFVITQAHSLWITRLLILVLLEITGKRRIKKDVKEEDKICVNMLIDETGLAFSQRRQDLYTAHEIAQLKPLINKNSTYEQFIAANSWIQQFLSNIVVPKPIRHTEVGKLRSFLSRFEYFAKKIQLWYMHSSITKEFVSDGLVAFHPFDYKEYVLREYTKRCKEYGIKTI